MYLVSIQLVRTWIILHLKHQDVLYCTWEVYTCMIRQECKAQTIEKPSLLCYHIYRYISCLFGIWWYIPVQVSMKTSYRYIQGYTSMYEIVWSCPGGGDSRCPSHGVTVPGLAPLALSLLGRAGYPSHPSISLARPGGPATLRRVPIISSLTRNSQR